MKPKSIPYLNILEYKSEIDLLRKVIKIYSVAKLDDKLENHEREVLLFYLRYGYSSDTKEKIRDSLDINSHYLNTINYHLDKKGYLEKDPNNKQKKHLTEGLKKLKEAWVDRKEDTWYVIQPKKKS